MEGYKDSLDKMKSGQEQIELDQLCWNVFGSTEDGRKLLQIMKDRFISNPTPSQINDNYDKACIYYEGYRAAFRYLINLTNSYQVRKDFEASQAQDVLNKKEH